MEPAKTGTRIWVSGAVLAVSGVLVVAALYVGRGGAGIEGTEAAVVPQASQDASAGVASELEDAPEPLLPTFDTVRVDADGQSLIAGRASPEARVEVLLDGQMIGEASVNDDGQFVVFAEVPASEGAQVMSLRVMLDDETLESAQTVLIEPGANTEIVANFEDPNSSTEGLSLIENEDAGAASDEAEPEAPRLLLSDESGVSVVQSPEVMSSVALDTITYTDVGDVSLGGRALGEGFVRIYLDDRPITTSRVAPDGSWRTALPDVDTGVYSLRVDELDAGGQVTSRVETPFRREDPDIVAQIEATPGETGRIFEDVMTVQPGATLWAIARDRYGEGQLYVKVFEANSDRIRDPDLIYPGQVFDLPD